MPPNRTIYKLALAVSLALAVAALALRLTGGFDPRQRVVVTGDARVGAPFVLTDQRRQTVADRDFRGRLMLVYFGSATDPDTTPAALQVMAAALDQLGRKADGVAPIFISIDPTRDTPEMLAAYLARIDKRLIGLTGTTEALQALTAAYHLPFKRIDSPSLPGGYSFAHQSLYYLMGRDGRFVTFVPHTTDPGELARALSETLQ